MDMERRRHFFIWIITVFFLLKTCQGYTLTTSSDEAIVGLDFTFTCGTTDDFIIFTRDRTNVCTINNGNTDGTCVFDGGYITDYTYTCNPTINTYTVTIPGYYLTESLHGTGWICQSLFGGGISNTKILYVNVPISSVTLLSTPTDKNPVEVLSNIDQTFSCTTNAGRPSSRIQWYLSTTNITTSASPQPDGCNTYCSVDKIISSSVLTYTGNINDDGKILYCTAINIEGQGVVRSSDKTIVIWYGPNMVIITPSTQSYTLTETEKLNQIKCTADCIPVCTITWSGPNLPAGTTSILNLQNINRNQAGNYQCTASNDVSSKTSVVVNVVVQYGPNQVIITPPTQSYTLNETDNMNQIKCTADCIPVCKMTWSGPNLPAGTTSELYLPSIKRNQEGNYQCTASNNFNSEISVIVIIFVNYGPNQVIITPSTQSYTLKETENLNQIQCTAECKPICTMTWNGPNLPAGTTSVLNLQNINRNQSGNYQCTAINDVSSKTSVVVNVVVQYGPNMVIISPSTQFYTLKETENLNQIKCTADCVPVCTMTWSGPNLPANTISELNLENINRNQAGNYQCRASNNVSSGTSVVVNVVIQYGPNMVIITPSNRSYTLKETENLNQIQCTADCIPVCTMTWSGPNLHDGTTFVLNLQNIKRNQAGNYQCTASNDDSSNTSVVVNVVVQYGPKQIGISPSDNTYTVTEKGSINRITCTADCNPSCTTTWTGPNFPAGSISTLNIQNIDRSQAGVYNCTAVNEISSLTLIKVNVIVNYGPRQVVIYPSTSNYTRNETVDGLGPINCTANCKPVCTSTWNGPNLPPDTTSVLNLANINRNQTGNYQCTASNDVSSLIYASVYVVVNYQPTISSISNDKQVNENDTATITCSADSIPRSIIMWIFEAEELQNNYDGSLTLNKIDCLSMGMYTCQAVNMLGMDNRGVHVTVKCSPRINMIDFIIPSTIAIKDKGILNITAYIIAFPKPEMYWQFGQNGSYVNVSRGITNSFNINRHSSNLVKSNLTEADFGNYSVYAYNDVGSTHYLLHSVAVVPARRPNQPINVTCEGRINSVTVNWKSGFNGGKNQTFTVYYKRNDNDGNSEWTSFVTTYSDPGHNKYTSAEIQPLEAGASFGFQVYALNEYNYTVSEASYCNTSEAGINENKGQSLIIGAGAGVGSAIVILLVIGVIVFMIKRRRDGSPDQDRKLIKRRSSNKEDIPTYNEADDIDGLPANPIYVSAEPRPNENAGKKMETEKTATTNENDGHIYSQVKTKDNKDKMEIEMGNVYENAEDIANSRADALRVSEKATMGSKRHHRYQPKKNKDGLVYADLELSPGPSGKRFVIRGLENRNNYAIIDLTKTAEPLPSDSESENEKGETHANGKKGNNIGMTI